jgi:two-component system sensor histidine kinase RegB
VSLSRPVWHVVAGLPVVRWATSAVLWLVVLAVWLLPAVDLPLRAIAPLVLAAAMCRTSVAAAQQWRQRIPTSLLGATLLVDVVLVTGLLDLTGGLYNPFVVMYVTCAWLAAVTVSPRWGVLTASVAALGFSWLVLDHLQVEKAEHHRLNDFPTHLFSMWLAGVAVFELVVHYVVRAQAALTAQEALLETARERAARSEHLAALTTLAAGAAHELSTPLATIAVAARELERGAGRLAGSSNLFEVLRDDARLIRTEVERCRVILDGMSGRAIDGSAAPPIALTPVRLAELAQDRLTDVQRRCLDVEIDTDLELPAVAGPEVVQALSSLLRNAFEAGDATSRVELRVGQRGPSVRIEVQDHGTGMSSEAQRRAGEPFYTTKGPGQGMGLGLFLARAVAERLGGTLQFRGEGGTTAILELPAQGHEATS